MPRINVENELTSDPRFFSKLCNLVSKHVAYGALICLWETGQAYWKKGQLIPSDIAEFLPCFEEIEKAGFVIKGECGGWYCKGARDRWAFLTAKSMAGKKGGAASVAARLEKSGSAIPQNASNQNRSSAEAEPKQRRTKSSKPKPSSSLSSSSSSSNLIKEEKELRGEPPLKAPTARDVISLYIDLWKNKFPGEAGLSLTDKDRGQLAQLFKQLGWEKGKQVVAGYFSMPDTWFVTKGYDVSTLILNLTKIQMFLNSGKIVTARAKKEIETRVDQIQRTGQTNFKAVAESVEAKDSRSLMGGQGEN